MNEGKEDMSRRRKREQAELDPLSWTPQKGDNGPREVSDGEACQEPLRVAGPIRTNIQGRPGYVLSRAGVKRTTAYAVEFVRAFNRNASSLLRIRRHAA